MSEPLADSALDQLFRAARTYNFYLDRPVSEDQLRAIWDLMKYGPTSANSLPARIVWCVSDAAKQKLAALAMPANAEKILKAPVTAIIAMDHEFYEHLPELFPHTDARSWFVGNAALAQTTAFRNASLQGAYFIMAARALGLDTGPMSGFDNAGVDAAFFADTPNVKSNFIATLGYGDPASIFERSPRPDFGRFNRIA
ncbi:MULTISPECIES: malonic semialdehyde reductase [Sphingopyxis]|jgi:3-hydroxypropanoate dehydrogenase|uniref:Putative NADH dehydrogenase/NAD(P)H nitroreductase rutE n=1 Tax=Sphingopyxis granuli TaxID=267128 RepID=A0A411G9W6_9SPHN|nr:MULTISPECIES: malonic semialdehyde reductase [Sphingopyxis]APW73271.1 malonic semialdehyde reductase [Sphingopyxis granuli]AVA14297.1 malonic semialdehyde reductase [Sphingopyxis sp. MG]ODU28360.1 MAG: malonic semialdehyde reductase [Sphingopyxis sp. SCN 67-31]QBB02780.1 nitroreductase [Sphingopyxis granuli]QUM73821.1 malonic semialdehyde reductase [Sphingopyxis granuli]